MLSKLNCILYSPSHQRGLLGIFVSGALLLSACSSSPLAQLFATETPAATSTPTHTLTPTTTLTPTPSPTPQPIVRVQEADHLLFNGDWNGALALYQAALDQQPDPAVAAAARYGLGFANLKAGNWDAAQSELTLFVQAYPTDPRFADAYFQLGEIARAKALWAEAIEHHRRYLSIRPGVIDSYAWERIGDSYLALGDYPSAAEAFQNASLATRAGGLLGLTEKKANALRAAQDYDGALALYALIANSTDSRYTLARMDILSGQTELMRGNSEAAYAYFLHAVENYPETYDAYQSLIALVDAGVEVNELQRGIVGYYAGAYDAALAAFNRYLSATPSPDPSVYYFAGLARRGLNQSFGAINNFQVLIDNHPESDYWDRAWSQKAYTQWAWDDNYAGAVETMLAFAQTAPDHAAVPEALFQAGRIAERQNDLANASSIWAGINSQYPTTTQAVEGAFMAGIALYRAGNFESAVSQFEIAANHPLASAERIAASWLWIGKTQRLRGDDGASRVAFDNAIIADPGGYYSRRAEELANGVAPLQPATGYDFAFDVASEKAVAEQWLADQLGIRNDGQLGVMSAQLAADERWVRGRELWTLGLTAEAKAEFDELRRAYSADALASYQIALALRDLGFYSGAIRAARASLDALGLADTFSAPEFFTHLRFGPYYADLITQAALKYEFDPLLLFAVVRQESLFEGAVTSSAAAQGLMQVIPTTGEWIALRMPYPGYQNSDLYRPFINVEFGAFYLDFQREYLNGDLYAALAAYNAGPGNAEIWKRTSQNDADLFLEIVRLDEPRRYIRGIYEFYAIYRDLYGH